MKNIRIRALWMAIGLVLGGSALALAGAGVSETAKDHGVEVSTQAKDDPGTVSDVANDNESETEADAAKPSEQGEGEHPVNHGFYVSAAAHCENVNDSENDVQFTAPGDCEDTGEVGAEDNGQAHGEYVGTVARSEAGKGEHGKPE